MGTLASLDSLDSLDTYGSTPSIPPQSQLRTPHTMAQICFEGNSLWLVIIGMVLLIVLTMILCYRTIKRGMSLSSVPIV